MNGRLLALVGAIGLFAYVWSSPEVKKRAVPPPVRVARMDDRARDGVRADVPAPLLPQVEELPAPELPEPLWIGPPLVEALPADLMPGLYYVVSNQGTTGEVIVPGPVFGTSPQELFIVADGPVNWYFIRQIEHSRLRELPLEETARVEIEELLPPPLDPREASVPQPRPVPTVSTPPEPPAAEITSKDLYLIEVQWRQLIQDTGRRAGEWLLRRFTPVARPPEVLLSPRPRFLHYAMHQRSSPDPLHVSPPRRQTGTLPVSYEQPAAPTCACPVVK